MSNKLIEEQLKQIMGDDFAHVDEDGNPIEHKPLEFPPAIYEEKTSAIAVVDSTKNPDLVDDYHYARNTLYGVIERGKQALEGSLELAKVSEMPRNYEVVATLINNITNTTEKLLSIHKKLDEQEAKRPSGKTSVEKQTNIQVNNYYESEEDASDPKRIFKMLDDLDK
mgnify:CR=1 FL=1